MIHGYLALLHKNIRPSHINKTTVVQLLSSISYVRNWHGFGMGQNRSDLILEGQDGGLNPDHRLLRFLQAYGIDTSRISKAQLEKFQQDALTRPLTSAMPLLIRLTLLSFST